MRNFIITICDDLDVFESLEKAEKYHEEWILEPIHKFRAYDQHGNILIGSSDRGKSVKIIPSGKNDIELLKTEIVEYLSRLIESNPANLKDKPLEELVDILIKNRGLTN